MAYLALSMDEMSMAYIVQCFTMPTGRNVVEVEDVLSADFSEELPCSMFKAVGGDNDGMRLPSMRKMRTRSRRLSSSCVPHMDIILARPPHWSVTRSRTRMGVMAPCLGALGRRDLTPPEVFWVGESGTRYQAQAHCACLLILGC